MATARQNLTPTSNRTPAVVDVASADLSGGQWVARFRGSSLTSDLEGSFKEGIEAFIGALRAAGAVVAIAATYRPPERAYLMHWAWCIVNESANPRTIPAMNGVDIRWDHNDSRGVFSSSASVAAAAEMVNGFDMQNLRTAPALASRHTLRRAIDMSIRWNGTLTIADAYGMTVDIATQPRTGMNVVLRSVGEGYGVIKYNRSGQDRPHWSDTGA